MSSSCGQEEYTCRDRHYCVHKVEEEEGQQKEKERKQLKEEGQQKEKERKQLKESRRRS